MELNLLRKNSYTGHERSEMLIASERKKAKETKQGFISLTNQGKIKQLCYY